MTGKTIKHYNILSVLGRGGMATVYLAEDTNFRTQVAVKVLHKEYVHNQNIRKRFIDEARKIFPMSHPNIVRVTDLIEDGDTVAFVMEYVDGQTLKQLLDSKGKLSEVHIKNYFPLMLDAVEYVHEKGFVHRDIKPSNFMISNSGVVKLLDFGIAKNTEEGGGDYTQTGTLLQMGTPMYMSPEQVKSSRAVTAQSDIYSLGVTLWEMITGRKPYDAATLSSFELQTKIVNEPLEKTNSKWDALIQKATAKDLDKRYLDSAALGKAFENYSKEAVPQVDSDDEKTIIVESPKPIVKTEPVVPDPPTTNNSLLMWFALVFAAVIGFVIFYSVKKPDVQTADATIIEKPAEPVVENSTAQNTTTTITENVRETNTDSQIKPSTPISIEWVNIPAGTFTLGSPDDETDRGSDETQHRVSLSAFKMSKYEVTFAQYDAFCNATGRSKPSDEGWGRGNRPVINVNWEDATAFARWMHCRLPTEAEWEYACRAGSRTPFNTGYNLTTSQANYDGNYPYGDNPKGSYRQKTLPVGSFSSNAWGLYDMHGNVWEWCSDWYGAYPESSMSNPKGPESGLYRVIRGGSWDFYARRCRSAFRFNSYPGDRRNFIGFRLVSP